MNDRKNITDALHKLNEDTDKPESPAGGPTSVTPQRKPTPAAPGPNQRMNDRKNITDALPPPAARRAVSRNQAARLQ